MKLASVVLLDDDPLILKSWEVMARAAGVEFHPFSDVAKLMAFAPTLSPESRVYIDSQLAQGQKGEEVAKALFDLGLRHLFLATGYPAEKFAHCYWLEGVVGKDPPF